MHELSALIQDQFDAEGGEFEYSNLTLPERAKLNAAYIRENPEIVSDVLDEIPVNALAPYLADITASDCSDLNSLLVVGHMARNACQTSEVIEAGVIGEIDHEWRRRCALEQERLRYGDEDGYHV